MPLIEVDRIRVVIYGRVRFFLKVPLGNVFIWFDLMTANGKSIKQNAPPSFFVRGFAIKQMDNAAG